MSTGRGRPFDSISFVHVRTHCTSPLLRASHPDAVVDDRTFAILSYLSDERLSRAPGRLTMDDVMSTESCARRAEMPAATLATELERFWPSRRGHAFDEFCR